ncbi:MAG: hypothetical protein K8I00_06855, partial [Candidatus Omnitrophica bacterium]|nr:hypothetical protein [Candidatus Omnitrophota bacterium]
SNVAQSLADNIAVRFGLNSEGQSAPGIQDAVDAAIRLVNLNANQAKKLAFSRELHEIFQEQADRANGDIDVFFNGIFDRVNDLRPGMIVFEQGKNMPRLYGEKIVTWLNRIIAIKGANNNIRILDDELVFFTEALTTLIAARYTQADEYISEETQLISNTLAHPSSAKFPGDNTKVYKLSLAGAISTGSSLADPRAAYAWGAFTGAVSSMDVPVEEKVALVEDLYSEVLMRKPRIDPIGLTAGVIDSPSIPTSYPEIRKRLKPYLQLLRSGQLNGSDDVNKLLVAIEKTMADQAQTAQTKDLGGIDLDPNLFDLERKGDGTLIFPKFMGSVEQLNINGLVPIIINVTPVPNLPLILGMIKKAEPESNSISYDSLDPSDNKILFELDPTDQLSLRVN